MARVAGPILGLAVGAVSAAAQEAERAAGTYDWTGVYGGVHAGYGWNDASSTVAGYPAAVWNGFLPNPTRRTLTADGAVGGGQLGYNYQIDRLILGIEADLSAGSLTGKVSSTGTTTAPSFPATSLGFVERQHIEPFASLTGRLGVAPVDRLMVYGTAGAAYGYVSPSTSLTFPTIAYSGGNSMAKIGWVVGAGVEYALVGPLSLGLEYQHYDLGGATVVGLPTPANPPDRTQTHVDFAADFVKVALNYHFGTPDGPDADVVTALKDATRGMGLEIGTRYWYSTGRTQFAYPTNQPSLTSKLTYDGLTAHSGEVFFRADHPSRIFIKGLVGLGGVTGGDLKDEDFPPNTTPYSATNSHQKDGSLTYYTVDFGYTLLSDPGYRFGPLVGYRYYHEVVNTYGCNQLAANPAICVPALPTSTLAITNDYQWNSVRLGFTGDVALADKLKLSGDAAWLPFSYLDGRDTHWLRLDTPGGFLAGVPQTGTGHNGLQLEAVLSYAVTDMLSLGLGGRFWHDEATGFVHFENQLVSGPGAPQPAKFTTDRYGGFLQAAIRF